jgi:hypothetical protein
LSNQNILNKKHSNKSVQHKAGTDCNPSGVNFFALVEKNIKFQTENWNCMSEKVKTVETIGNPFYI